MVASAVLPEVDGLRAAASTQGPARKAAPSPPRGAGFTSVPFLSQTLGVHTASTEPRGANGSKKGRATGGAGGGS